MAQVYTSGPCPLYAKINGVVLLVGHSERFPRLQWRASYSTVMCDLAGQSLPIDYVCDGVECHVIADITRFNQVTMLSLEDVAKINVNGAASNPGTMGFGEIGTLMVTEGVAYELYVVMPYTAKPAFATQVAGYHFYAAMLENDDFELGSTARKQRMMWHCVRKLVPAAGGTTVQGVNNYGGFAKFLLYDYNVSDTAGVSAI